MGATADLDTLLLPTGTRLVHIGPPKTATSSVQGAFHAARDAVEAQGVHYAGKKRHSGSAVQAVLGRPGFYTDGQPASISHWERLLRDVRRSRAARVVISSEFFADAVPESIPRIVDDLDAERVHVVVTLRPLAKIIPSQWQQYVQSGSTMSFDRFLDAMLNEPGGTVLPTFWRRHRHGELVARWAGAVGAGRVTVLVLDDADHDAVLRLFERLTGLVEGTLREQPDLANRSMTMPEIEAVRALNLALKAEGMTPSMQSRIVHFGAAPFMRRRVPEPDEARVETPQWVLDRVAVVAREAADAIAASGVRVVGDLESLAVVPAGRPAGDAQAPVAVPPAIAASMAMGVLYASGLATDRPTSRSSGDGWATTPAVPIRAEPAELVRIPTRELYGILFRRSARVVRSRVRRIRRRIGGGP